MFQFLILIPLLPVVTYIVLRWKHHRFYRISSELPGPANYPLIGCGHLFIGKSNEEQFAILNDITKTYPSPCRAWLGPKMFVFIDNPEDMQVVLNSTNCLEKADLYRFFRCEKGLFSSPASIWKVHRKLLSPCFSPAILSSFVSIFNTKSEILVQRLEKNIGNGAFNLFGDISRCTLDMICATTLGTNMDLQSNEGTEFIKAIEDACELINSRLYKFWLHPEWIYQKTKYYKEEKDCYLKAYKMSHKILELKQEARINLKKPSSNDKIDLKKPQIYIDQILRLAEDTDVFDDRAIRDELDTIIVGGNETSALTLSHVMLMLAIHQDVQQKVYNEIVNVLGSRDPTIAVNNDHLPKLIYTEMVMKETMRLFPVGPIVARTCTAPTRISKTTIPEGTNIVLGVYNVHRNPKHWGPDVDRFNPDNFFPERVAERHPYSFLPFSGGPRNCIGYKYGLMSMKIMLCHLLRAYRFRSPLKMEQLQLKMSITLKIANRHMVTVEKREGWQKEGAGLQYRNIRQRPLHAQRAFASYRSELNRRRQVWCANTTQAMWHTAVVWLILTVVISLCYYRWRRRKVIAMLSKMSGPRAIPFLGHVHLMREFTSGEKVFHTLMRYSSLYTSPLAAEVGPLAHIFVYTPAHIQTVLTSPYCLDKPLQYSFFKVNRAIFGAPGDLWKLQRKLFTPSFGPSILHSFVSIFNEKSSIMVDQLAKFVGKPQRNYYGEIVLCFLDTICGTAFGVDADLQRSPLGAEYAELQENFVEFVTNRLYNVSYYSNFIYTMTNTYRKDKKNFDGLMSLLVKATQIEKHENRFKISDTDNKREHDAEIKKPQIFIDKLIDEIQKDGEIKREDLRQHLLTICFAGNDTTATTMSALLLMLAMHPDIQERVFQEVMVVCPEKNQFVTMEDAAKLTYTEMVCKETMRMFPVAPMIGRVAKEDIKLDDELTIPANSTVVPCIYKVHMDPEIWGPDVKKFNPDNFLPDRATERHPYAYLPFSGGPRNCLGVRYGWLSMKILLVHILRRYRLRTTLTMDTMTIKYSIFLKIVDGCALILDER
ncbi:uncharacterized protein LOC134221879 [Armigeres subalbatus]|uniref:uncharacterized protein LOC134221879 n=1 Tax=Armigeres subalbatus TaxID=124917 RepID=UPI002ED484C2